MRIILFKNGAVVNNTVDIALIPGEVSEILIAIPGYIAGSLTLITSLEYTYEVDDNISHILVYVPEDYAGHGVASMVVSYATTSIHGTVYYLHDASTHKTSRLISITNDTGTSFDAEIGVSEDNDIHAVHQLSYVIVGEDTVKEGTDTYPMPSDIDTDISFYVDIVNERVWTSVDMEVNGGEPIPGELVITHPVFRLEVEIESGITLTDEPQDAVVLESSSILHVAIPSVVHFPGIHSLSIVGAGGTVTTMEEDGGVVAVIPVGAYSLLDIVEMDK